VPVNSGHLSRRPATQKRTKVNCVEVPLRYLVRQCDISSGECRCQLCRMHQRPTSACTCLRLPLPRCSRAEKYTFSLPARVRMIVAQSVWPSATNRRTSYLCVLRHVGAWGCTISFGIGAGSNVGSGGLCIQPKALAEAASLIVGLERKQ
jgi:hypothetical protein